MTNCLVKTQEESTLYIPSMYDSEEENEDFCVTDTRDESTCNERQQKEKSRRYSRFSLMRSLAWSQAEDDQEDEGVSDREEDEDEEIMFMIRNTSGNSCLSFSSVHSALVDSINHLSISGNHVRPVHWEEQVTIDKKLDSFLSGKKTGTH